MPGSIKTLRQDVHLVKCPPTPVSAIISIHVDGPRRLLLTFERYVLLTDDAAGMTLSVDSTQAISIPKVHVASLTDSTFIGPHNRTTVIVLALKELVVLSNKQQVVSVSSKPFTIVNHQLSDDIRNLRVYALRR